MQEKYFALVTQIMLTIVIPGLPLMVILALQNNPHRNLSNWIAAHRKPVLAGYAAIIITALAASGFVLTPAQIWQFLKYATVPTLIGVGIVFYPFTGGAKK